LLGFVEEAIEPGSLVHTDGWEGYAGLTARGYRHEVTNINVLFTLLDQRISRNNQCARPCFTAHLNQNDPPDPGRQCSMQDFFNHYQRVCLNVDQMLGIRIKCWQIFATVPTRMS